MKTELCYTYWHERKGHYSHPEIRVYKADELMTKYHHFPDEMFSVRSQCDTEKGFSIWQSYGLHADIRLDQWSNSIEAAKILAKLAPEVVFERGIISLARWLHRHGATRYVLADIGKGDGIDRQWVPRKYKRHANAYWEATQAGLKIA